MVMDKYRRGRFIAPIADLSALAGLSDTSLHLLNCIIAHIADLSALAGLSDSSLNVL